MLPFLDGAEQQHTHLLGRPSWRNLLQLSMDFLNSLAISLDPWKSGDLGCVAIRKQSYEDATGPPYCTQKYPPQRL